MDDNRKELLEEAIQNIRNKKYADTLGILDKLAETGDRVALFWLSERYRHSFRIPNKEPQLKRRFIRIPPEREKSLQLLQQSADLGFPPAQYKLGFHYYTPHTENRDLKKAFLLFKSAAEQGYVPAMYRLSACYLCALGVTLSHEEGIRWCKKAAEAFHPMAEYQLARLYFFGRDVNNDAFGPIEPDLKNFLLVQEIGGTWQYVWAIQNGMLPS